MRHAFDVAVAAALLGLAGCGPAVGPAARVEPTRNIHPRQAAREREEEVRREDERERVRRSATDDPRKNPGFDRDKESRG